MKLEDKLLLNLLAQAGLPKDKTIDYYQKIKETSKEKEILSWLATCEKRPTVQEVMYNIESIINKK